MKILAILENMWGDRPGYPAPLHFSINPDNYTGKKLYRITAGHELRVTNAYSTIGHCASHKPGAHPQDRERLERALASRPWDGVLVCGVPAQKALEAIPGPFPFFRVYMPHPASRSLTNLLLKGVIAHLNRSPVASARFVQLRGGFSVASLGTLTPQLVTQ